MSFFLTILFNLLIGLVVSDYARRRGKDPFLWFIIGTALGIFALLILYFLPNETLKRKIKKQPEPTVILEPPSTFEQYEWHYLIPPNLQHGPIPFSTLKSLFSSEKISSATYVWHDSMPEWKQIHSIPGLIDELRT